MVILRLSIGSITEQTRDGIIIRHGKGEDHL